MKKEKWIFRNKYLVFYFTRHFDISYEICGYFDNRPRVNLDLFFFNLTLILPFKNKWTDECDAPKWGIAYHNQTFWIYRGGKGNMNGGNKWWTAYAPWSLQWMRTSTLLSVNKWFTETKESKLNWKGTSHGSYDWLKENRWQEVHDYTYVLKSGKVQNRKATIGVREMEWRWHWFKWLPITKKVCRSIDIDFDDEVGERTGSWKGGTLGCSYNLFQNETPLECLRRMEKERKF